MKVSGNLKDNRYQWAINYINALTDSGPYIFDIGARDGIIADQINIQSNYQGFDLFPKNPAIKKWDLNDQLEGVEHKADYILLLDVVEHLNNPWLCMKNLSDVLKPNGELLMTMPNPLHSEARFTLFSKGWMPCFSQSDLELNHHVFTPWPHIIEKLLADNGLIIEKAYTIDGTTTLFDKLLITNPFRIFKRAIKRIMESRNKMARGMSYAVIAKKVNG